jgi:hypothetical protein
MESLLWILLEAAAALAALIFIVWWTWPKGNPDGTRKKAPPDRE